MKVSFVVTVLNEEKTISKLLDSLTIQTKLPDEIIVVDGGSEDSTVVKIKQFNNHWRRRKINIFVKKGNRSVGRNAGIKYAKGETIIVTDAGCWLDQNWIKNITKPFIGKTIDVAGGYYKPFTNTIFEKCLATYTCVMPDKIDPSSFLPSSRSIAFTKDVWNRVGGYPEELDTCEDLIFAKRLKLAMVQFCFVQDAFVYWPQRHTFFEAFKQFYSYAKGDGKAHYFRKQTPFLFFRLIFLLTLFCFIIFFKQNWFFILLSVYFVLYIVWSIQKNYYYVHKREAFVILPLLQMISDVAVFMGTTIGIFSNF